MNLATSIGIAGSARQAQVSGAAWDDGMNYASCQPGIGINTGNFSPKPSDWAEVADTAAHPSQFIGGIDPAESTGADTGNGGTTEVDLLAIQGADINDNVAFVEADGSTVADAVADAATGAVNKTGVTVPAGAWLWGVIPNA